MISGKRFCSSCGAKMAGGPSPRAMSDIKPAAPATPLAPAAVAAPPAAPTTPPKPVPAGALDLRQPAAPVVAAPIAAAPPVITSVKVSSPIAKPRATPMPAASPSPASRPDAASPARSPLMPRFPQNPATKAAPVPELPNAVATQIESLQAMAPTQPDMPTGPSSPQLQQAMAAAKPATPPGITRIAAALAAIALMAGFVWLQNSPKLAFRSAAAKAGIDASLPTYVPSSYRQTGPATVSDGQLVLSFQSPSAEHPLTISQRRTNWDSHSLRENYITKQSDNYLAVQGQGLTIYLFNDQAGWVNHGVWYTISGTAKLSREQILKIAYGL